MNFYLTRLIYLITFAGLSFLFKIWFDTNWWIALIIFYAVILIYVLVKHWAKWKAMGFMFNELIKNKLGVTEVKKDENIKK